MTGSLQGMTLPGGGGGASCSSAPPTNPETEAPMNPTDLT
jgi:hypothetical protein